MGKRGEKYYDGEDVITSYGKYHRPFCHVLRNVANYNRKRLRSWKDAEALGLQPCGLCKPYNSLTSTLPAGSFANGQGTGVVSTGKWRDELAATEMAGIRRLQQESTLRQDAIISQLERFAELMKSTDRASCEGELRARFNSVWGKLSERVRSLLLASEQKYRTSGYAAPAEIVAGIATAFELQLQHTILAGLFAHLKDRKVRSLQSNGLPDAEDRERPLWRSADKAERCTLGTARLILQHPQPEIGEFFSQFGYDLKSVREAIESIYLHRNPTHHGVAYDIGTVDAIRHDWFSWKSRDGGVFSAFFR
jgi:hypothetical protein